MSQTARKKYEFVGSDTNKRDNLALLLENLLRMKQPLGEQDPDEIMRIIPKVPQEIWGTLIPKEDGKDIQDEVKAFYTACTRFHYRDVFSTKGPMNMVLVVLEGFCTWCVDAEETDVMSGEIWGEQFHFANQQVPHGSLKIIEDNTRVLFINSDYIRKVLPTENSNLCMMFYLQLVQQLASKAAKQIYTLS